MKDSTRIETIEIKLVHLERSLQELAQTVMLQQREIAALAARGRALSDRLDSMEDPGTPSTEAFEKPPHY